MNREFKEQRNQRIATHRQAHRQRTAYAQRDISCPICHPAPAELPDNFRYFWNWLTREYEPEIYTSFTVLSLDIYIKEFQNDPARNKKRPTIEAAYYLVDSIRYLTEPTDFTYLVLTLLNVTHITNYF